VQEEFFPAMQQLLDRRQDLDCIAIETSGLALPKPLITAFRWPEIRNGATVDAVIAVVDAPAVLAGQFAGDGVSEHETPLEELFEDQLACADLVVVNKTDLISAAEQETVLAMIREHTAAAVKIVVSDRGLVDAAKIFGWSAAVEDNLAQRPSHHDAEEEHEHDEGLGSIVVTLPAGDVNVLTGRLQELVAAQEIYRVKGFVAVPGKAMRMVLQGVGQRFESFFDRAWRPAESRVTQLVIIGQDLDEVAIRAKLEVKI
jgi:cobalamin biosynthesis protein CobW